MTRRKIQEPESSEATSTNTTTPLTDSALSSESPPLPLEQGPPLTPTGQEQPQDEGGQPASQERRPIEEFEATSGQPRYLLAAARSARRWLPGQEVTEADFKAALDAVKGREVL